MTSTRPRILEVLYSYGIGGSQVVALELARQLKDDGADVLCAALNASPGPSLKRCDEYGLQVVELAVPWTNPLGRNGVSWALVRRLRKLQVDAIHLQHFLGLHKLGLPARLAGIKRIVATEHSVFDIDQSLAGRFRARLNWRLASGITVVHDGIKDYLCERLGIPDARVTVIPVGIDVNKYHRDDRIARRRELDIGEEMVFVFVGRLAPVKKVPSLLKTFLAVQAEGLPRARCLIVGDGEEMPSLRAIIKSHPLGSRVTLTGECADVRPYLAAGDVFVLNSSSEGMPRALLEALATGMPAICPAVGSIPELIKGRGWLTEPGNQSSLAEAMRLVLSDQRVVEHAGEQSRTYVRQNFDARSVALQYRQLLTGM